MNYVKDHAMALLIGAVLGYFVAKKGGLTALTSGAMASAKSAV